MKLFINLACSVCTEKYRTSVFFCTNLALRLQSVHFTVQTPMKHMVFSTVNIYLRNTIERVNPKAGFPSYWSLAIQKNKVIYFIICFFGDKFRMLYYTLYARPLRRIKQTHLTGQQD